MTVRLLLRILTACILAVMTPVGSAWADIVVRIQLSQQTMNLSIDGADFATWSVSTARPGYRTPIGVYRSYQLERMHYSRLYDFTPMPFSIFFRRGYAIHGTADIGHLGRPVSHGCVRLGPDNAKTLFELVKSRGLQSTTIQIVE